MTFWKFAAPAGLCVSLLSLVSCIGSGVPDPTPRQAAWSTDSAGTPATLISLNLGRDLFITRCDGCHQLPRIQDRDAEAWNGILNRMSPEAKLTPRQDSLVRAYVLSAAGMPQGPQYGP